VLDYARPGEVQLVAPEARAVFDAMGDHVTSASIRLIEARVSYWQGELAVPIAMLRSILDDVRVMDTPRTVVSARLALVTALLDAGEHAEAAARLAAAIAHAQEAGEYVFECGARTWRTLLHLDLGRVDAAGADIDEAVVLADRRAHLVVDEGVRPVASLAALFLGRTPTFWDLPIRVSRPHMTAIHAGVLARVLAGVPDAADAVAWLETQPFAGEARVAADLRAMRVRLDGGTPAPESHHTVLGRLACRGLS
jgi:hypothetical protein